MLGPLSLGALHHVLRTQRRLRALALKPDPDRRDLRRQPLLRARDRTRAPGVRGRARPVADPALAPAARCRASGPPLPRGSRGSPRGVRLVPPDRAHDRQRRRAPADAEEAGVLTVARDRVRFTHPLLASAVYGSTHGTQLLELHRRLADVVDDPEERAQHLALCTTEADEAVATELEAAAASAARRGAQDAAADLYDAAFSLTPAAEDAARGRRLVGRAVALHATGDPETARELAERAAETAPPGATRADALLELSRIAWVRPGGALGPLDYLRLALDDAGEDRQLSGMIQAKLGMYSDEDHVPGARALGSSGLAPRRRRRPRATRVHAADAAVLRRPDRARHRRGTAAARARARGARGPRCRAKLACPDLVPVHGRARGGTGTAPAGGRVVPRPGRGNLGRREARASAAESRLGNWALAQELDRTELRGARAHWPSGAARDANLDPRPF